MNRTQNVNAALFKRTVAGIITVVIPGFMGLFALSSCTGGSLDSARSMNGAVALKIVNDSTGTYSSLAAPSGNVSSLLTIGTIYLDAQLAPVTVSGVQLQASDVAVNGTNMYISYSSFDTGGVVSKIGAVELVKPLSCGTLLGGGPSYCLTPSSTFEFPTTDIFAAYSDGTNLFAVGSTSDAGTYGGRLHKLSLDGAKAPVAITASATLNSYAGTGVVAVGSSVLATYGTSYSDATKVGGLQAFDIATLTGGTTQGIVDARGIVIDPSNSANAFVIKGPTLVNGTTSAVLKYGSAVTAAPTATYTVGGNTITESKSTVVAGTTLMLATTGSGGFKVLCKATGAEVATQAPRSFAGLDPLKTVINSVAAIPGYIFTANGEAGVNVYTFKKPTTLVLGIPTATYAGTNYCQGVVLTYLGRLALDSDNNDATYINAELSANSIKPLTVLSVLGVITSRLLVVASGNKGVSLLDVGALTLSTLDIDDF